MLIAELSKVNVNLGSEFTCFVSVEEPMNWCLAPF